MTMITIVYDTQITIFGWGYQPTNITGGPHPVWVFLGIFHSCLYVYRRVNLHFRMVFLWCSHFPMVFLWCSHFPMGFPMVFDMSWFTYEFFLLIFQKTPQIFLRRSPPSAHVHRHRCPARTKGPRYGPANPPAPATAFWSTEIWWFWSTENDDYILITCDCIWLYEKIFVYDDIYIYICVCVYDYVCLWWLMMMMMMMMMMM